MYITAMAKGGWTPKFRLDYRVYPNTMIRRVFAEYNPGINIRLCL